MKESIRRKGLQVMKQMAEMEEALKVNGTMMTEERIAIVEMKPMDLLSSLRNGDISALQVLRAFQSKALQVTKELNCVTEFIPEAEIWAESCDSTPSEEKGFLHGLPVSIKDSIDVKGMDSSLGLGKNLYNPATSHSAVVRILLENGAVPFCKTNVSQAMLSFSCSNPVYGVTINPHNPSRTSGGSSGGEGALIGAGGSVVGIGSDLAGSIRVPSNFSGCDGLRPTSVRLSSKGIKRGLEGMTGVMSTIGVMARDVDILTYCMKVLCGDRMHELDSAVPPSPWNELKLSSDKKLVFGYYDEVSHIFPASPGVKRAVHEAKSALEMAGHKVIPFEIEDLHSIYINLLSIIMADDGKSILRHIKGESVDPSLSTGLKLTRAPFLWKQILKFFIRMSSPLAAELFKNNCVKSSDLWHKLYIRTETIRRVAASMKDRKIDLLLSPVYAIPAPQHFIPSIIGPASIYTVIFNYFDFPSGSVVVTKESESDQQLLRNYPETNALYRTAKQATKGATGIPIGVLVSGLPYEDETVCKGMKELEKALILKG